MSVEGSKMSKFKEFYQDQLVNSSSSSSYRGSEITKKSMRSSQSRRITVTSIILIIKYERTSSNDELFADIERSRFTQNQTNSSNESKDHVRSKTFDRHNRVLDRAINKFTQETKVIIDLPEPPTNEEVESDNLINEITRVFNKTEESQQLKPQNYNSQKYGSYLSTEISNEPDLQKVSAHVLSFLGFISLLPLNQWFRTETISRVAKPAVEQLL